MKLERANYRSPIPVFEKSDNQLKDRLDYAYRNFQALKDFCLWLVIFSVTTVVSFYSFLSRVEDFQELRAGTVIGSAIGVAFLVCFCLLFRELRKWNRTQAPIFLVSEIPGPPSSLVFTLIFLSFFLLMVLIFSLVLMPLSWRFPPPPWPPHAPAP